MCGISGIILPQGELLSSQVIDKMSAAMTFRGPDAEGIYLKHNVGLAHRRLKIIDLSDSANQPMANRDGKIILVYNGEVYNYRELRSELEILGYSFRTQSDTEVVLYAYEEWGTESFRRLNGIFAMGILDLRGRDPFLVLVRDRFGIKPLFYAVSGKRIAFASVLRPLMTLDWIKRDIKPETLFHYLQFSHVPCPTSIFSEIDQLRPGTWMRYENGHVHSESYWDTSELIHEPSSHFSRGGGAGSDDWENQFERVLNKVVSHQAVGEVPMGCFLSGGIDSSLITLAYSKVSKTRVKTFSIGYHEAEFNEAHYAREVSQLLGTDHHELIVSPKDFFELIPSIPDYFDQPFADPTLLSSLLLMKFARKEITVGFSGDGADELFFGYTYHQMLYYLNGLERVLHPKLRIAFFKSIERLLNGLPFGQTHSRLHQIKKLVDILQYRNESELYQHFIGMIGPLKTDRVRSLLTHPPSVDANKPFLGEMLEQLQGCSSADKVMQVFMKTFLTDTVLAKTDRASMAYGIEARVPFLDNEMVDFSKALPFNLKYRNFQKKALLRRVLGKHLPHSISNRKKQGFSIPLRTWSKTDLKYLLDEYLNKDRLSQEGVFVPEQIQVLIREHLENRANHSHLLWTLLSFQLWKQKFLS